MHNARASYGWLGRIAMMATLALGPSAHAGDLLAASDGRPELVIFDSDDPGKTMTTVPLTGLASGEVVLGLDTRPLNGELYLLGSTSRVYVVNEASGTATPLGPAPFSPVINGRAIGFDFNPTVDRIRLVTDVDQNMRLIPAGIAGEGTVAGVDTNLNYLPDDAGFGFDPRVGAVAYDNNDNDPNTGLDTERDVLLKQVTPNAGTLMTIGALGDDFTDAAGFDVAPNGHAWAVLQRGPRKPSRLYSIDLVSGVATLTSRIKGGRTLTSLAVLF